MDSEIQAFIDKQKITELLYTYCRAVDRVDAELGYTIWHDGSVAEYGTTYQGTGPGIIDFCCASHKLGVVHSHQITNVLIELDGNTARSEAYVTSGMIMMEGDKPIQITTRGRYLDNLSKRNGRWGIDKRTFIGDINEVRAVTYGPVAPRFTLDRNDPSYGHFAGTL